MSKLVAAVAALVAVLAVALPGAFASQEATPGVTRGTVKIGATFPLSGSGAVYAPIAAGMQAYFAYINASPRRRPFGRRIQFIVYDDQYPNNLPLSLQLTRRLVEQDRVFATVGSLGTEPQQLVRPYMNQRRVPQLYVSTGATMWGAQHRRFPWTIGWQPDYQSEGRAYGDEIRRRQPNARIAVLYSNDDYGRDYLRGFERGIANANPRIVAREAFEPGSSVTGNVVRLRQSGANTFLILAIPTPTITAIVTAYRIGWRPQLYVNSVSATDTFFSIAASNAGSPDAVRGAISTSYLKDPASPAYARDRTVRLYRSILRNHGPQGANPNNGLYFYGMAKAHTFVQTLRRAGRNPTRGSVMRAARTIRLNSPWLLPRTRIHSRPRNPFPISTVRLIRWNGQHFEEFGPLIRTR
ncbi:MAG: ABC transporter substrate-binding protein [Thermoleophilia bacterium]|nr:ABC transporter substrate-binding protein [Thermoleophilia bacterium]